MMNNDAIGKLQKGDKQALETLFVEFGCKLYKSAIFFADSREEAEDLVQETFARAFVSIRGFKGKSSIYTWLYRILLNISHDLRRKKYIHTKFLGKCWVEDYASPKEGPIHELEKNEFAKTLHAAMQCQKMKYREIIVLRYFEDLKLAEIAERLDIGIGTVKSRLHHALKKLKKSIGIEEQFKCLNDK